MDTLEEPSQANIATIQMDPLGYRERDDDVITRFILWDVFIHPVSASKSDIMRKFVFRCVQVERVRRWDGKRTKHVLA